MIIQTTAAYDFNLSSLYWKAYANDNWTELTSSVASNGDIVASVVVVPGSPQVVPDWVSFCPLFLQAVANGTATVIKAPTGATTINAGETSSNVALPLTGQNVVITNTGSNTQFGNSNAWVLLGDSSVTVSASTGIAILPGSSIILPLGTNTYLAAIGVQPENLLNIAVI